MKSAGVRTIRGQLTASLVLFELLALLFFSAVLMHEVNNEARQRMLRRLEYQASELDVVTSLALRDSNAEMLHTVVTSMLQFPTISSVQVTDLSGRCLAATDPQLNGTYALTDWERAQIDDTHSLRVLVRPGGGHEATMPVLVRGQRVAFLWIYPNERSARTDLREMVRVSALGVAAVLLACTILASLIARSLTRPLTRLLAATRSMIENPEDTSAFPLPVTSSNEAAELTIAFNLMVASIHEQRTGLHDTLSLLDSMLANAPIGIAFFDRNGRFVRVNQHLAQAHPQGTNHYLGRRVEEVFASLAAAQLMAAIELVFEHGTSVQELEIAGLTSEAVSGPSASSVNAGPDIDADTDTDLPGSGETAGKRNARARTWLVNAYPVRTAGHVTRWAGVVLVDITQRLLSEEALRRTEKLAVTGRLSASIAHEINNPLEAVTNLLYLLQHHGSLTPEASGWATAAQHELLRVSEIAQQTLRFYRQSTRREQTSLTDLFDAVLTLHQGRVATLQVDVLRRYRDPGEMLCFSGELRQLFANLVGNALDAMQPGGGRLTISVRASRRWHDPARTGVRVILADTGCGMSPAVRERIFEPFFTTKEATGTGLGLWVSAEIMAKHQVELRIRSRQRGAGSEPSMPTGTVFMLFFPYLPAKQPEMEASILAGAALAGAASEGRAAV